MMLARCTATVFTLRSSFAAISLFDFPSTISCRTSSSRGVRPWFALAFQATGRVRQLRIEHGFSGSHALDGGAQVEIHGVLEHVAARAGFERLPHQRVLGMHAQHQDGDVRVRSRESAASPRVRSCRAARNPSRSPAACSCGGEPDRFVSVAGFADDGESGSSSRMRRKPRRTRLWSSTSSTVMLSGHVIHCGLGGTPKAHDASRPSGGRRNSICRRAARRVRAWRRGRSRGAWPCVPKPLPWSSTSSSRASGLNRSRTQACCAPECRATLFSASCSTR